MELHRLKLSTGMELIEDPSEMTSDLAFEAGPSSSVFILVAFIYPLRGETSHSARCIIISDEDDHFIQRPSQVSAHRDILIPIRRKLYRWLCVKKECIIQQGTWDIQTLSCG